MVDFSSIFDRFFNDCSNDFRENFECVRCCASCCLLSLSVHPYILEGRRWCQWSCCFWFCVVLGVASAVGRAASGSVWRSVLHQLCQPFCRSNSKTEKVNAQVLRPSIVGLLELARTTFTTNPQLSSNALTVRQSKLHLVLSRDHQKIKLLPFRSPFVFFFCFLNF